MEAVCKAYKMKFAINCVLLIYKHLPRYSSKLLTTNWLSIVQEKFKPGPSMLQVMINPFLRRAYFRIRITVKQLVA